jgi:Pentapeptide repeats (8 copies)
MSDAYSYKGLIIEIDSSVPRLTIEGREMWQDKVTGIIGLSKLPDVRIKELRQVAEKAITDSVEFEKREAAKEVHRAILRRGAEDWNKWREDNPETRPMLYDEDFSKDTFNADLKRANFANANLINTKFIGTDLEEANFHEANLKGAHLNDAKLTRANFCRADLYETDFSGATLVKANLQGTQMAKTIFKGATITDCKVYGMSAWDVNLEDAKQSDLIVRYRHKGKEDNEEDEITVYDLRLAQFVYLLLNNENIGNAIDSITWKTVLILGRFTPERISVLEALREVLRKEQLVPILFDFEKPQSRNLTETISLLATMARFIVADLTDARSVAAELERIVPHFSSIPVQPMILKTQHEYALFEGIQRYPWVIRPLRYDDLDDLAQLAEKVIANVLKKAEELAEQRQRIEEELES